MTQAGGAPLGERQPIMTLGYPGWRSGQEGFDHLAHQWVDLACTHFITPKPAIAGMVYLRWQRNLVTAAITHTVGMVRKVCETPSGAHLLSRGPGFSPATDRLVHFPQMECWVTREGLLVVPPAWHLEEDWYMAGMVFQRPHPAGEPVRLLRHPIRDPDDVAIMALGLAMRHPGVRSGTFPVAANLREALKPLRNDFEDQKGYPPNLAALWRGLHGSGAASALLAAIEQLATRSSLAGQRELDPVKQGYA